MRLWVRDLHLCFRVVAPFVMPFHAGSLIRGVLGRALYGGPFYDRLFSPRVPAGHPFLRCGAEGPPALLPLLEGPRRQELAVGVEVRLGLRLLAPLGAVELRLLREALARMAEPRWHEGQVRWEGAECGEPVLVALPWPGDDARPSAEALRLRFVTPVWLEQQGEVRAEVSVLQLCRAAFRRFTGLCAIYGELHPEHRRLLAALEQHAAQVHAGEQRLHHVRWRRESCARGVTHPLEGLLGSVELPGAAAALGPLWAVAEQVHLGKQTSFGLGRVRVEGGGSGLR